MSADTVYQQVREHLHYLGLRAAADTLAPALEHAEREQPGYTRFLHDLLAHEVAAVEQRRLQGRLRFAKLPARKTIEQFDFAAQPGLDRRMIEDLATLRFVEERANLLLIGPPGVGKTMLATALGHKAVEAGYRVYYTTAADLVARTAKAAIEGRWATTMRFWNGPQLLIVDELGYLPLAADAASHFFQVVSRRYEHGSIVLTTNRHIADWGAIFDDTTVAAAILDRLLHHATVLSINGDSYRMRAHRDAIASLRPAITGGEFSRSQVGIRVILDTPALRCAKTTRYLRSRPCGHLASSPWERDNRVAPAWAWPAIDVGESAHAVSRGARRARRSRVRRMAAGSEG